MGFNQLHFVLKCSFFFFNVFFSLGEESKQFFFLIIFWENSVVGYVNGRMQFQIQINIRLKKYDNLRDLMKIWRSKTVSYLLGNYPCPTKEISYVSKETVCVCAFFFNFINMNLGKYVGWTLLWSPDYSTRCLKSWYWSYSVVLICARWVQRMIQFLGVCEIFILSNTEQSRRWLKLLIYIYDLEGDYIVWIHL